jgi:hypothetical protein
MGRRRRTGQGRTGGRSRSSVDGLATRNLPGGEPSTMPSEAGRTDETVSAAEKLGPEGEQKPVVIPSPLHGDVEDEEYLGSGGPGEC